ncbi:MAG: 50S ribosomal protein L11 methyltransferase [Rickettsiales bacterium]|nr:50S ribosomal protein L11 methyltransferase [Rickettsiales bacterium]
MLCAFVVEKQFLETYTQTFESLTDLTISYFPFDNEEAETAEQWQISIYTDKPEQVMTLIEKIRKKFNLPSVEISTIDIENKDWVTEVQKNFKPILVNNIYIYSSFYQNTLSQHQNAICINIDPGNAFGTGEHHTTKGCLRAISQLSKTNDFINIIDVGSGSAILAIAAAKLFRNAKILATDIDMDAVKVAQENIEKNNAENILAIQADGIDHQTITTNTPFELIICNILSSVLIQIASDINNISSPSTILVLSGLTIRQLEDVTDCYNQHQFKTLEVIYEDEWCTIIMKKL